MPEQKIKVGNDNGEGIELTINENRIFIAGQWKGRTSKSKKGNWNMAWFSRTLFDELIAEYQGKPSDNYERPPDDPDDPGDSDVPF